MSVKKNLNSQIPKKPGNLCNIKTDQLFN